MYGRLSRKRKGVELAIRAVENFARGAVRSSARGGTQDHPVRLILFDHLGPGNEEDPRDLLRTRLPHDFHIDLSQDQLAALYASSDIYVSAERRAGWSNTVAEAMACGTPVICTRSGTLDLALHRQTAWVVRWRHPWFFTRALHALHRDPALRQELRSRALEHVRSFAWGRVTDALLSIIERRLADAP